MKKINIKRKEDLKIHSLNLHSKQLSGICRFSGFHFAISETVQNTTWTFQPREDFPVANYKIIIITGSRYI